MFKNIFFLLKHTKSSKSNSLYSNDIPFTFIIWIVSVAPGWPITEDETIVAQNGIYETRWEEYFIRIKVKYYTKISWILCIK